MRTGAFLVLLALAALHLRVAMQEQAEYSGTGASEAMILHLRSPFLLTWHARRLHLLQGRSAEAEALFQKALSQSPYFIPAWLGLAEMKNDRGSKAESRAILDYVDQLSSGVNRWRWEKALLTYQMGRYEILEKDLSWIIENIPGASRQAALKMSFSLWPEPMELLRRIGPHNIVHLFNHASQIKSTETALAYWPQIEQMGVAAHRKEVLVFLNALIAGEELTQAASIWKMYFNDGSLLYNGSFQQEPTHAAFDWRVGKPKGSTWRVESFAGKENFRAMRLHFSGTENISYHHLSQLVPIRPGRKYQLTGQIRTTSLTTDQRPYFEVSGFQCAMPPSRSEMVDESQPWTAFALAFDVTEDCQAVQVRVRRDPSKRLDNLLAGDLWLRDLAIEETGEHFSILDAGR